MSDVGTEEAESLIDALVSLGFVARSSIGFNRDITITTTGWIKLDEKRASRSLSDDLGFLAMRFDPEFDEVYHAIRLATERTGYCCERVDSAPHADHIDHRLVDYLRRCRFVVADFTGNSHNVYFEAGYALALGKPVIWTIKKGHKPHFDVQQYYFREWDPDDLPKFEHELEESIGAIVGRLKPKGN